MEADDISKTLLGLYMVRGPTGNNDGHSVWEQQKEYPKSNNRSCWNVWDMTEKSFIR
jgi:hypothetical protein